MRTLPRHSPRELWEQLNKQGNERWEQQLRNDAAEQLKLWGMKKVRFVTCTMHLRSACSRLRVCTLCFYAHEKTTTSTSVSCTSVPCTFVLCTYKFVS